MNNNKIIGVAVCHLQKSSFTEFPISHPSKMARKQPLKTIYYIDFRFK